jgi:uncharacterized spore protein YtfJ
VASIPDIFKKITDRLETSASVKTVYGEPMTVDGKTIIPVAKVSYGFGAGGGSGPAKGESSDSDTNAEGFGGGGGGGVEVTPLGVIEITPGETRFVPIDEKRRLLRVLVFGAIVAIFLLRRRKKKK